jgi:hypothetical protein
VAPRFGEQPAHLPETHLDINVGEVPEQGSWRLTDLLGRSMGTIVPETPDRFVIRPEGHAVETMEGMRLGPYHSLDAALAAIESHTRGVCRRV